jgi:hydrogenase expression/formation protein HypC
MCLAIPGKVIEVRGKTVVIDYGSETKIASIKFAKGVKKGAYVIASGGHVIRILRKKDAEGILQAWADIPPEQLLLRYAYPCISILEQWGEISKRQADRLRKLAIADGKISKAELEKVLFRPIAGMRKVASNIWDSRVIRAYYFGEHNRVVESPNFSLPALAKLCKVRIARVLGAEGKILSVKFDNSSVRVLNPFALKVKPGDRVVVHYNFAVEVI